ncbi:MAG: SusC/RagA family TonB-linked outer membrane protein [Proteiniphilum sp.]|nr:SusC/RagA family TonB-linked outer membrane protein [Proteiniphilum sp.]MDD3076640.1 SusC/RagA family TonB-linked outer membrane protein [Proteiniphilum sp.]MDD4452167.1 SusC/RagA family TonB-linked outer membrane protein [Proteiniphilum sp.]
MIALFMWIGAAQAQSEESIHTKTVTLGFKQEKLFNALLALEEKSGFQLVFPGEPVNAAHQVNLQEGERTVAATLQLILQGTDLNFKQTGKTIVLFLEKKETDILESKQTVTVRGSVKDDKGEPLPGAVVMPKDETKINGTVTDVDGNFLLSGVSANEILLISFLGYETVEVAIEGRTSISVTLQPGAKMLEELVVTGYQSIARGKVTGAVSTVNSNALQERYTTNIMSNLEGRVAGLVTDGDNITIRGTGSLHAVNNPLVVVDGLPIEGSWHDLNPYDIESITVLKDAAATAMYGSRASAGIIVITTKKPREEGRISVDVQANFTIHQKRNLDYADNFFMTPEQQVDAEAGYYKYKYLTEETAVNNRVSFRDNTLNKNNPFSPVQYAYYRLGENQTTESEVNDLLGELRQNNYAKEYGEQILRNQLVQQYNIAVRSMSDKYQSSLVLNYKQDNLGYINENDNRFTIFYKGEYKMAKWLNLNFGVNSILQDSHYSSYDGWLNKARDPFSEFAYSRLINDDGSHADHTRFGNGLFTDDPAFRPTHYNALDEMSYDQTRYERQSSRYNGGLLFYIMEGLTAQGQFIYETERNNSSRLSEAESYLMRMMRNAYTRNNGGSWEYMIPETGGRLVTENRKGDFWTTRGQLNYSRLFAQKHAVDLLAGVEFRQTRYKGNRGLLMGYDDQLQTQNTANMDLVELRAWQTNPYYYDMNTVSFFGLIESGLGLIPEERHRFASGYGNLTYSFNDKYNLFGSFRKDYADVYGLNSKYRGKPLWSVGASWVASDETFMKNNQWINYLKLRGSYGITGNIVQNVTSIMVASTNIPVNTWTQQPRARIDRPANPFLTWEKTATTNIGLDFGLFQSRLRGALDFYYKNADDVYALKTLEPTTGFSEMWLNMAGLYNKGVELDLTYDWFPQRGRDRFDWTSSLTMAYNQNEITHVESLAKTAGGLVGDYKYMEGYPTSAMWSYRFGGLTDEGQRMYLDKDDSKLTGNQISGKDTDAVIFSGQREPKITMGLSNTLRYRGFSLAVMAVYYGDYMMRSLQAGTLSSPVGAYNPGTMASYLLDAWTPENTDTTVPGIFQYDRTSNTDGGGAYNYLDIYVQPADFIKIRNIVLGYDLPQQWTGRIGMQYANLRFQIDNLPVIWTKNRVGVDPETGGIRRPTTFIVGLALNF